MKTIISIITLAISGTFIPHALADNLKSSSISANKSKPAMRMPLYQPPRRGAPNIRVGGGTRGLTGEKPTVYVLAPDHVGLTVSEQPSLSWYVSKPSKMRLEILVIDEEGIDPLLELTLDSKNLKEGIQSINLAKHGVKLKPNVKYQWSVVLIAEEGHRSNDVVSSGMIERRTIKKSLTAKLAKASSEEDVFIYAQEGYWYNAINALRVLIKKNPNDLALQNQYSELLTQVGLTDIK